MFESVPAAMVAQLLDRGYEVARSTAARAASIAESRERIRESLLQARAIVDIPDADLDGVSLAEDEVSAIDGAFICDNQSIGDLCTAVAVSVGPKDGQGESSVFMESVPRASRNKEMLQGIMASMEILMAASSDAKVVLVDGSMLSGLISISKAMFTTAGMIGELAERLKTSASDDLRGAVWDLLTSPRFVALPKYTTKNELAPWIPSEFRVQDAKTVATLALRPGEATAWILADDHTEKQVRKGSIGRSLGFDEHGDAALKSLMEDVVSCYYRPHPWTPAFRLDLARSTAENEENSLRVLRAIRDNTTTSGILEPFPLFLVDQYAKQISAGAAPMVSMAAMENIEDDDAQLLLAARYRS